MTLPPRWAAHPVVVTESAHHRWDVAAAWWDDDALLVALAQPGAPEWVYSVGTPDAAALLLLRAAAERGIDPASRTTVPRGTRAALRLLTDAAPAPFDAPAQGAWDWLMVDRSPDRVPGEERVEELVGPAGRDEARAALVVAHPDGRLDVDEPASRWWGWRDDDGVLRGVAGADLGDPGTPWWLSSVGTAPDWRGRGIASAATAVAVRAGLKEAPMVTLHMHADNDAARRTYVRLGFSVEQEFESSR